MRSRSPFFTTLTTLLLIIYILRIDLSLRIWISWPIIILAFVLGRKLTQGRHSARYLRSKPLPILTKQLRISDVLFTVYLERLNQNLSKLVAPGATRIMCVWARPSASIIHTLSVPALLHDHGFTTPMTSSTPVHHLHSIKLGVVT